MSTWVTLHDYRKYLSLATIQLEERGPYFDLKLQKHEKEITLVFKGN